MSRPSPSTGRSDAQEAVLHPEPVLRDEHVLDQVRVAEERHPTGPIATRTTSPCVSRIARRKRSGSRMYARVPEERHPRGARGKGGHLHLQSTQSEAPRVGSKPTAKPIE